MKKLKLSFLIPAHNEEKIIAGTLEHLISLPYDNYEIILGLDGCTDNTEKIVSSFAKKSKKIKYYKTNLRQGKPAVINEIIKHITGDIIIINDADWLFTVKDKKSMTEFLSVFGDSSVGGIAESFPVEWDKNKLNSSNIGYKMVAYSSFFWFSFQKDNFTTQYKDNQDSLTIKNPRMFLTNIFRKSLYRPNSSLGDDFERTAHIMESGYKVVLFTNPKMPRMVATYNSILVKDLLKQKIRTAIARRQVKATLKQDISVKSYYLPSLFYMFTRAWKRSAPIGFIVTYWIFIAVLGEILSKFSSQGTKEGWKLRARR